MPTRIVISLAATLAPLCSALAQPHPAVEPVPVEVALEAVAAAYESKPTAEEVSVRFRTRGSSGGERSDTLVVKLQPGATPRAGIERMFLDLGQLKVLAADRKMTAISTAAPDKFAERAFDPPLTPEVVGKFIPPVPLPQLAFGSGMRETWRHPTPYTTAVTWGSAVADTSARPPTVTITGACATGEVTLVSDARTGRLLKLTATVKERSTESVLELTCHAVEPGDPASWAVKTEGRQLVPCVGDLRPAPAKGHTAAEPGAPGAPVAPDLACTKPDMSAWSLHGLLKGETRPLVMILFRRVGIPGPDDARERDAKTALAAIRNLKNGMPLPGETPGKREPMEFRCASAVALELAAYSKDRWDEARRGWGMVARGRSPIAPLNMEADELMWAPSGGAFIDRLSPGAGAIVVVVMPDLSIRATIKLDDRYKDASGIGAEVRGALQQPAAPKGP